MNAVSPWIATVFRIGYLPLAPGTWGSIAAFLVWYFFMTDISPFLLILFSLIVFFVGVLTSNAVIQTTAKSDPSEVVIDELAGQWIALVALPHTLGYGMAALVLFRILDIFKPPPIKQLERLPGGWGIMLDDAAAGIMTCIILNGFLLYL